MATEANFEEQPRTLQPLTAGGVALFADARFTRTFWIGSWFAFFSGLVFLLLVTRCYRPVLDDFLRSIPPTLTWQEGTMAFPRTLTPVVGANSFLSLEAVARYPGYSGPADIRVQFWPDSLRAYSLLGMAEMGWPTGLSLTLQRNEVLAWWGAWKPFVLLTVVPLGGLALMIGWSLLAVIYCPIPWAIAKLFKREIRVPDAWKISFAAQFTGSLIISFGLTLYAFQEIRFEHLLIIFMVHFAVTWFYLLFAPFFLARIPENPFKIKKKEFSRI